MSDYFLRKWTLPGRQPPDVQPDVLVWDRVVEAIADHSRNGNQYGLLLGSVTPAREGGGHTVVIDAVVSASGASGRDGEFSQEVLAGLEVEWGRDFSEKSVVGWYRCLTNPPQPLRLTESDARFHQNYFSLPYQVALGFTQQGAGVNLGFFKANRGELNVERFHPFLELSDAGRSRLNIQNLQPPETPSQPSARDANSRQTAQSIARSTELILRFGVPIVVLLAVATAFQVFFGNLSLGKGESEAASSFETAVPPPKADRPSRYPASIRSALADCNQKSSSH